MKNSLSIVLFIALSFFISNPGFGQLTEQTEPYLVKHFDVKRGLNLEVQSAGGNISVTGTDAPHASVAVVVTDQDGNYDKAAAAKVLEDYSLEIREEKNTIFARAIRNTPLVTGQSEMLVSFRICIPRKTNCRLISNGGAIALFNIKGNTRVATAGGTIGLCKFTGDLKAETNGGAINVNEAEGSLQLLSKGGCINLKKVAGDVLARSGGGSIYADIRKLGKFLTLETEDGSLKAHIPGTQGLNLDVAGALVKTDEADFKGTSGSKKVKGSVNGGGIPVKLHSASGSAELRFRS